MQLEFFQSKEYQLLREIGRGGMASVYEAIETSISRRVAIKILPPSAVSVENLTLLNSALNDFNELGVQESAGAQGQAMQARAKLQCGEELERLGRHAEAERQLSECVGHFQQLSADYPKIASYRFGFGIAAHAFGGALQSSGKASDAMAQFNRAIELLTQLESDFPRVAEIQHYLAGCLNNMGNGLSIGESVEQYEEALKHELIAIGINPDNRQYRRWVVTQSNNLAIRYEDLHDREKVVQHLQLSIDALRHLIQIGIATYDDRHNLGHAVLYSTPAHVPIQYPPPPRRSFSFWTQQIIGKNGSERLLPSYLRSKLGWSLALTMKLLAIPMGRLDDLPGRACAH